MSGIPALSIMQPWCWLIAVGLKRVENRSWNCTSRRPILLHAGMKLDREAHESMMSGRHPVTGERWHGAAHYQIADAEDLVHRGGIIGTAEIRGCVTDSDDPFFVGPFGIIIAGARELRFQPCKGALGFFKPKIDVDMSIMGRL